MGEDAGDSLSILCAPSPREGHHEGTSGRAQSLEPGTVAHRKMERSREGGIPRIHNDALPKGLRSLGRLMRICLRSLQGL